MHALALAYVSFLLYLCTLILFFAMKRFIFLFSLCLACGSLLAATAANGVFSVSATKTVQFSDANEACAHVHNLMTWEEALAAQDEAWTLLSIAEWEFLLSRVNSSSELMVAGASVDGHYGLVLLPDGWTAPSGITVYHGGSADAYMYNNFSASEWETLAASGAVFLPCQGYSENGSDLSTAVDAAIHGSYWSKTEGTGGKAYRMQFDADGTLIADEDMPQGLYYSVRLAKEVKSISENDDQTAFDSKMAALRSETSFYLHRTLYKDGYFNTLCLPFNVADIAASPLAGAEVFTFESGEVVDNVLQLDIKPVTANRLEKGVPYLIRWSSGEDITAPMLFTLSSASDWDEDDQAGTDPGSTNVKYHGFYYKTHLVDAVEWDETDWEHPVAIAHYNFFLGADDALFWPTDGNDPTAKMKGFRAHFYVLTGSEPTGGPSAAPARGMPAVLRILDTATGITTPLSSEEGRGEAAKYFRNGQIILIFNGEKYDLGGHKL